MDSVKDDVTIVTGAGAGIGKATAKLLAQQGHRVMVTDHQSDAAKTTCKEIIDAGAHADAFEVDVTSEASCRDFFNQLGTSGIVATGLVNCAGIAIRAPFVDMPFASWQKVIDTNLSGTMRMAQLLVNQLGERAGAIVNIASVMGHFAAPNLSPYAASKGGVIMLTRALAVELATRNIRVNAVSPGYIETSLTEFGFKVPRFAAAVLSRTPMKRFGKPIEIARVISFLLSDNASFLTGQDIVVDGGMTAGDHSLASPNQEEMALARAAP